ncbi:MAG: FGGY family carbohydrate kinase [Roseiarcus sp.]|jgi:sugar (pentulose or hexulose) kinase
MLFVADRIPPELRKVVEFMNVQMRPAEVLAVELRQYQGGGLRTPSSIMAVGLTGYGNGLYLLDRHGKPVRNGVLSPDLRAREIVARWRASGLEDAAIPLTYQRQWPGKPAPLLAWPDLNSKLGFALATY